jgi:hypothetical protein
LTPRRPLETEKLSKFARKNNRIIKGAKNITEAKATLMNTQAKDEVAYYFSHAKKRWYKFTRKEAPREITREETENIMMYPPSINELLSDDTYVMKPSLNGLLDDCDMVKITMRTKYEALYGLVGLMITTTHRRMNQFRNILSEITRIATLQQATVEHKLEILEDDEEGASMVEAADEIKAELKTDNSIAIINAEFCQWTSSKYFATRSQPSTREKSRTS